MPAPRIGIAVTDSFVQPGGDPRSVVRLAADAGLDYLTVGDHVSFHDGLGFDGLLHATALLAMQERLPVAVGLYLLALRHPVLVARQLSDIARIAPGRMIGLGVGVGGEDRHEFEVAGVDPATRGRRTDEALAVLGELLQGKPVTHHGRFFSVEEAVVEPPPSPAIPILVGGRSDAALRRTARFGEGWLALWVSARRFAEAVTTIAEEADRIGRQPPAWRHGLTLWCAVDRGGRSHADDLAAAMERRYALPFDTFRRWCPSGSPSRIAEHISEFAAAGCTDVTLVNPTVDPGAAVEAAALVRECLAGS